MTMNIFRRSVLDHSFSLLAVSILLALTIFPGQIVAATPSGTLACGSSTSSSIVVHLTYANTGTTGASLYRFGAPGNGMVASFPGNSGSGSHTDSGLNGTYHYQLRSGSTVLVTKLTLSSTITIFESESVCSISAFYYICTDLSL